MRRLLLVVGMLAMLLTRADAGLVQMPIGPAVVLPFTKLQGPPGTGTPGDVTTWTGTLSGTASGSFFTVETTGKSAGPGISAVTITTNNGTACTHMPNAFGLNGGAGTYFFTDISYCTSNAAAGSVTFTATETGAVSVNGPAIAIQEWTVTPGFNPVFLGNWKEDHTGTATTLNVSPTNVLSQNNQLVVSVGISSGGGPVSVGSGQTFGGTIASWQIADTAGSIITHSFTYPLGGDITQSIAVFGYTGGGGTTPSTLVQHTVDTTQANNGSGALTYTMSAFSGNVTAGNMEIVSVLSCLNGACSPAAQTVGVTSITHTRGSSCTPLVGSTSNDTSSSFRQEQWWCPISSTGADAITINWASSTGNSHFPVFFASEWANVSSAPDDGIGNAASATTGTAISVATNGAASQVNELIISQQMSFATGTLTLGQTSLDCATVTGTFPVCTQYQIPATTGVKTNTATGPSSNEWAAIIAGIRHP